jgi:subtilisin family serine protease
MASDPAVIAVVDTGIAREEIARLPFKQNPQEKDPPPVKDWDHNGYPNDVIGVDLITQQGNPYVASGYPYADHGLQISSIATGASFMSATSNIANFVKLKMLSIVEAEPVSGNSPPSWRIVPGDFVTSISYIRNLGLQRAIVANWSWEASGYAPSVSERVSDGQELIAVAAGNRHAPLNNEERAIPSRFSLTPGGYVISVAALRPDGKLADFSNYGSLVVTLAAPGCSIPVFKPGGGTARADGTSMASPLVALAAAIVKTLDADASAESLYKRIIAATDHLPALESKVIGGRVLNIPDTISVYDDVVRLTDGTTLRGRITGDFNVIADDQSAVPVSDVLRYTFAAQQNGTLAVSLLMNRHKESLQTEQGTTRANVLRFMELGSSSATTIPVGTISTIIPAMVRD